MYSSCLCMCWTLSTEISLALLFKQNSKVPISNLGLEWVPLRIDPDSTQFRISLSLSLYIQPSALDLLASTNEASAAKTLVFSADLHLLSCMNLFAYTFARLCVCAFKFKCTYDTIKWAQQTFAITGGCESNEVICTGEGKCCSDSYCNSNSNVGVNAGWIAHQSVFVYDCTYVPRITDQNINNKVFTNECDSVRFNFNMPY